MRVTIAVAAALVWLAPGPAGAGVRVALHGLADAEIWETDAGSTLLSRNGGEPAVLGRVRLWAGAELDPRVQVLALGMIESGNARAEAEDDNTVVELEQVVVRFAPGPASPWVIEAGKLPSPVGAFAARRFSNVSPLIGTPDVYETHYPWGVQVAAALGRGDVRAAVVSLPVVNTEYTPEPSPAARPAFAVGYTPTTGLRVGASFTAGPYLGTEESAGVPAGSDWNDFGERIVGLELQFSRGYFACHGEVFFSRYEVPTEAEALHGFAHYTELQYTWSPRFFSAVRLEQNDYASVRLRSDGTWRTRRVNFYDAEAGMGYRLGARTLVKAAYRRDLWKVDESLRSRWPDGHSVSTQVSHSF